MDVYLLVKTIHIISSTILFGTGIGIAFFMFLSSYTQNLSERYFAARFTVLADYIFTAPAVILQPVSGVWLIMKGGYDPHAFWLQSTYALYLLAGLCWLPVVWIQIQLRAMLSHAVETGSELPDRYHHLFKIWFMLGWPAFLSLIAIFWLMVSKPV